jgi:hypothetical protein
MTLKPLDELFRFSVYYVQRNITFDDVALNVDLLFGVRYGYIQSGPIF